jgi:wyosine [tRNA(Phe)-imidazoG37] synthetase (radical SAM superfamily)
MPTEYKLCSFDCVYCHYGFTKRATLSISQCLKDLPTFDDVVKAVEEAARSSMQFNFLTFSGNGEPTLHPEFAPLVEEVVRIRDAYRPEVKIALLSNSSGLSHRQVRESISEIDIPVFKLDAGSEKIFRAINRPAEGVDFAEVLDSLSSLNDIYIQTLFIQGTPSNATEEEIARYFQQIRRIRPKEVHIYSIDRPVPNKSISLVSPEVLEGIARQGQRETGVRIRPFYVDVSRS